MAKVNTDPASTSKVLGFSATYKTRGAAKSLEGTTRTESCGLDCGWEIPSPVQTHWQTNFG